MSSFDEQIRNEARAAFHEQHKTYRDTQIETANALGREAARLKALSENPEWQWFRDTHLLPLLNAEHDAALDTNRTAKECRASAHRHAALKQAVEMLATKAQDASDAAQRAFAEIPQE